MGASRWRSERARPGRRLRGSTFSVVFGRHGEAVVVGDNGDLHAWTFDPVAWTDLACRLAGRNLDPEESSAAFGDRAYHRICPSRST